jgi:threonine/homoserine/homoserine lactone efflux protein
MEIFNWFLKGLILGLSIAAPVGPIGVLCIRRTLAQGRLHGFLSGLGAATADGCYGFLAATGLTILSIPALKIVNAGPQAGGLNLFRLVGAAFLIYLAARIFFSRPPSPEAESAKPGGLAWSYFSTLLLTLSNPMTILSFAAIFAGLGLTAGAGTFGLSAALVAGVFCGSASWWLILSTGVGLLRSRVTPLVMSWINRASGLIIAAFGLAALVSAFM